jgi:hypothetical protein
LRHLASTRSTLSVPTRTSRSRTWSATLAGMRPRSLTASPCSFAQARISTERCRLDAVRPDRRPCARPTLPFKRGRMGTVFAVAATWRRAVRVLRRGPRAGQATPGAPRGCLGQVVVAVPARLLSRVRDQLEDPPSPGRDLAARADHPRLLLRSCHVPIQTAPQAQGIRPAVGNHWTGAPRLPSVINPEMRRRAQRRRYGRHGQAPLRLSCRA